MKNEDYYARVYVANLGAYNEGVLRGKWIDLPCPSEDFRAILSDIGVDGVQYEEWFFADNECNIPGLTIHEYANITEVNYHVHSFLALDKYEQEVVDALIDAFGLSLYEATSHVTNYNFVFYPESTLEDAVYEMLEEGLLLHDVPEHVVPYLDKVSLVQLAEDIGYAETQKGVIFLGNY